MKNLTCRAVVRAASIGLAAAAASTVSAGGGTMALSDQTAPCGVLATNAPAAPLLFSVFAVAPMIGGAAVGDFNRDGWSDIYFAAGGGAPDRLFINNQDGTFTDQAAAWGIASPHMGLGACVGDYNRDGWPDIFVTSVGIAPANPAIGRHRLYRNNGNGTFTDVAAAAGVAAASTLPDGFGATFGDYDLDGDLDLFVTGWVEVSNGNRLFRNNGDGTFTDVTAAAGLVHFPLRGFAPGFIDMNGDRYPELLIAADFGTAQYYINNGNGTFTRWTTQTGVNMVGNGMGSAVGDFNRDGRPDWYITSIHSYFLGGVGIPGTGNMLFMNQGDHAYLEQSVPAGVNDGGWGWGTVALDMDHDGWEDLVETNGWPFTNDLGVFEWMNEPSYLWKNNGDMTFTELHAAAGMFHTLQGRGLIHLDIDNDGDQDIGFVAYADQFRLFRNDLAPGPATRWLKVFLDTSANPFMAPDGIGSVVRITAGGVSQMRPVHAMNHYLSTGEIVAHFGLGTSASVDTLRVEWPNGVVSVRTGVAANQALTIRAPKPGDADENGAVGLSDIALMINHWDQVTWEGDVSGDGRVDLADVAVAITYWGS